MNLSFVNLQKNVTIVLLLLFTNITSLSALSLNLAKSPSEDELLITGHGGGAGEEPEKLTPFEFWLKLSMIFLLVLLGGLIAGLTLGLMSLDETNLTILINSGTPEQRKYASLILPIRKNGHLLLVTLLLTNTLINESLPIFLDSVFGGGYIAIFVSTGLILVFGEVIPQSICARHGLRIGAFFAWPVRVLIYATYIVTYPIAKGLDWLLGEHHGYMYRRAELKELVAIHEATKGGSLTTDEVTIIKGALDLSEKSANHAMTDLKHVFMLNIDSILDTFVLSDIVRAGHSRIPVFENERTNIIGVLLAKSLIMVDPNAFTPVRDIKIYKILSVTHDTSLFDLLNTFQEGACHMTVVTENINGQPVATGVVTLEDVIEELIQEEIIDETDVYSDVVTRTKVTRALNLAGIKRISKSRMNSTGATPGSAGKDSEITPLMGQDKRLLAVQQDRLRQLGSATPDPCTRRTKLFTTPKEEADPLKFTRFTSFQNAKERQHLRPFAEADREDDSGSDHSPIAGSL